MMLSFKNSYEYQLMILGNKEKMTMEEFIELYESVKLNFYKRVLKTFNYILYGILDEFPEMLEEDTINFIESFIKNEQLIEDRKGLLKRSKSFRVASGDFKDTYKSIGDITVGSKTANKIIEELMDGYDKLREESIKTLSEDRNGNRERVVLLIGGQEGEKNFNTACDILDLSTYVLINVSEDTVKKECCDFHRILNIGSLNKGETISDSDFRDIMYAILSYKDKNLIIKSDDMETCFTINKFLSETLSEKVKINLDRVNADLLENFRSMYSQILETVNKPIKVDR